MVHIVHFLLTFIPSASQPFEPTKAMTQMLELQELACPHQLKESCRILSLFVRSTPPTHCSLFVDTRNSSHTLHRIDIYSKTLIPSLFFSASLRSHCSLSLSQTLKQTISHFPWLRLLLHLAITCVAAHLYSRTQSYSPPHTTIISFPSWIPTEFAQSRRPLPSSNPFV